MKKMSKIIVMLAIALAVLATMSIKVNAYTNSDLIGYVTGIHNINGITYELSSEQKSTLQNYLATHPVDESQANSIKSDIDAIESKIASTGATSVDQISATVKSEVISQAKTAATKAGLEVDVNTSSKNLTVKTSTGDTLISTSYVGKAVSTIGVNGEDAAAVHARNLAAIAAANSKSTLLYTGSNYAICMLSIVAIIAVAVVVKKCA